MTAIFALTPGQRRVALSRREGTPGRTGRGSGAPADPVGGRRRSRAFVNDQAASVGVLLRSGRHADGKPRPARNRPALLDPAHPPAATWTPLGDCASPCRGVRPRLAGCGVRRGARSKPWRPRKPPRARKVRRLLTASPSLIACRPRAGEAATLAEARAMLGAAGKDPRGPSIQHATASAATRSKNRLGQGVRAPGAGRATGFSPPGVDTTSRARHAHRPPPWRARRPCLAGGRGGRRRHRRRRRRGLRIRTRRVGTSRGTPVRSARHGPQAERRCRGPCRPRGPISPRACWRWEIPPRRWTRARAKTAAARRRLRRRGGRADRRSRGGRKGFGDVGAGRAAAAQAGQGALPCRRRTARARSRRNPPAGTAWRFEISTLLGAPFAPLGTIASGGRTGALRPWR